MDQAHQEHRTTYRKHVSLWCALCLLADMPLDPALECPVGRLGLLVPLLVWPHFSSNTSITADVAATAPPPSERGRTDNGVRLAYLYAARLNGASLTFVHVWLTGTWLIERTACAP
jgi:hypothetical protein